MKSTNNIFTPDIHFTSNWLYCRLNNNHIFIIFLQVSENWWHNWAIEHERKGSGKYFDMANEKSQNNKSRQTTNIKHFVENNKSVIFLFQEWFQIVYALKHFLFKVYAIQLVHDWSCKQSNWGLSSTSYQQILGFGQVAGNGHSMLETEVYLSFWNFFSS